MKRRLSKSRLLAGDQCEKLLWLRVHEKDAPELEVGPAQQALFDGGHEVGELAQTYFPGGVLVDTDDLGQAISDTKELVKAAERAIYEASFSEGGLFTAVDVLEPVDDGWVINEAKATTSVKPQHLLDVAAQIYVLRAAGLQVVGARLVHLNSKCTFPDLDELFTFADVFDEAERLVPSIAGRVERLVGVLAGPEPQAGLGAHCKKPYACPFWSRCSKVLPKNHIGQLYRLHASKRQRLEGMGVETIGEIPAHFSLTETQERQRAAVASGELVVLREGLRAALERDLEGRCLYLDFETISFPIPRWEGCRPWQQIPVQFSLHIDGGEHREFLAEGGGDPRRPFVEALLEAVPEDGPIVVYNKGFEAGRLRELAGWFPEYEVELGAMEARLVDLLPIVRNHVYHPGFGGSFSIKAVQATLNPEAGWGELEVQSGDVAAAQLKMLLLNPGELEDPDEVRSSLLAYCKQDTWAMVELLRTLHSI